MPQQGPQCMFFKRLEFDTEVVQSLIVNTTD